jgi:tetratricopeptide (TPR) repeat protein
VVATAPERIGKYRVLDPLGRGGMGSVYKAHDPVLDRMVAIKVMTEGAGMGTEARERFLREAQSAARLNHSNIITVYELGEDGGQVFIVMELLEGSPLSRVIASDPPLPTRKKLALMTQICDGLAFAHQRGVVHRDIKPANIFVLANGQVKILDFGIARVSTSDLTRTGLLMGTPNYMSPEQARGKRTDQRSDIFSVGVVFYELLSGKKPFDSQDYFETMEKVRAEEPPHLGEVAPDLPPVLVRAVHRALAKDPGARYQSLDELRSDLGAVSEGLTGEATPENLREAVDKKFAEVARLHRTLVGALGAAALGDETLPLADPTSSGGGLETVLRDLEGRTDRLRSLARTVDRLDPNVARGIAAFERGAFEDAADALYAVLQELPQHQRAREYYDRVRIELLRERTVRSFAPQSPGGTPTPATAAPRATPVAAAATPAPVAVATPLPRTPVPLTAAPAAPPVTTPEDDAAADFPSKTWGGWHGRRFGVVAAGVALAAVVGSGLLLHRAPSASIVAVRPPAYPARPAVAPKPPAVTSPTKPGPAPTATAPTRPAPSRPAPAATGAAAVTPGPTAGTPAVALTAEQVKVVEDAMTLAQLFEARGDHERALREYRRALAIDPKHREATRGAASAESALKGKR